MLQLMNAVKNNPQDKTQVTLLFANVTPQDILLKAYLDDLAASDSRFTVKYTVDKADAQWTGETGYVTQELLQKAEMPAPGKGKIFVCGPNPMVASLAGPKAPDYSQGELAGLLKKLGYSEQDVFKF
jgi:cytochrome-b5 reductase